MSQQTYASSLKPDNITNAWYHDLQTPRPLLVVISGPSGVGKDATIRRMKERGYPCHFIITATNRPCRPSEVDGVDYHFMSDAAFKDMLARDEFLEHADVYGQLKGIPKWEVRDALASGRDAILRVDVQGAATVRRLVPHVVDIFLTAESETELINRLQRRRTETDFELQRRIKAARSELKQVDNFKYRVINRECQVDQTVDQVIAIMHAEKCRTGWRPVQL